MIYFEDFKEGDRREWGDVMVDAESIIGFARQFDPQPMHLDAEAAKDTLLGGLAASGWQSCVILMRMMCDDFLLDSASMGSPGVTELRWERPVMAGDRLKARREVLSTRASKSRPEMGIVNFRFELLREDGTRVLMMESPIMFGRKESSAA